MSESKEPVCPTINLNGSSPDVLIDQLSDAVAAVRAALTAVAATRPHGRDYTGMFTEALREHEERYRVLSGIDSDLSRIRIRVMQQRSDWNKQKEG